MTAAEMARDFALAMIAKSGVKEWLDPVTTGAIADSSVALALAISDGIGLFDMAITATFRQQDGTQVVFEASPGAPLMTPTSLANGSYWQSAKADLGATRAQYYGVEAAVEFAATPTSLLSCELYWNPSDSNTAGTNNKGGCSGTDAAYTGYSSNADASAAQLLFVGILPTTAQATATVQKGWVGVFSPPTRYGSFVIRNSGGSAFHSSASNFQITMTPQEYTAEA